MSVLLSPCQSPSQDHLLLLLAEVGSLSTSSNLGQVLHSTLVGAFLLAKSTPKASYQRWWDGCCSSARLLGLSVPSSVPSAAPHPHGLGHEQNNELPPAPGKASTAQFHVNTQLPACPETVLGPTAGSCLSSG